ncbi:MAG: DUF2357 domain-containing protein [Flavobacteriales bacterium]|jgi:predicted component of viral defense system (DUF524 family)|nr:DUF2357 domain-containing protein [Flavobacteriales bacterium]
MVEDKYIAYNLSCIQEDLFLNIDAKKESDIFIDKDRFYENEPQNQIKEGCFYDYSFTDPNFRLVCRNHKSIVKSRTRKGQQHIGTISPNIYVGTLSLEVYHIDTPENKHEIKLEVQSTKTSYRKDYQYMLNSITEKCTDLVLQANAPVSHSFETDFETDNKTLYQRFVFVKSIINSEEFEEAIHRIISSPTTKWKEELEIKDVRSLKRFKNKEIKQLIHGNNRTKLSVNHPLYSSQLTSIATKINSSRKTESVDTSENRFIKHALETFAKFCFDIANHPNAGERLQEEANSLVEILENHLQHYLFKEVSRPSTLKLNSPTLQKKEGYREVLKVWLKFDLAAKLIWDGGEDIYEGGKKDIATLYEYWLFFKLLDVIQSIFEIEAKELDKLITSNSNNLNLQLKQGKITAIKGVYTKAHRDLNIRFNYNRSFSSNKELSKSGSWTTTLRPDYTLSIWPTFLNEKEAEAKEQIVHIHFDAKYKVANIHQIIEGEKDDEQLNDEKKQNLKGIYKNADLLKMHAYKDAIRRTSGAYVLYPGDTNKELKGFHEILPGLGAFSVKPSEKSNETKYLERFLKEVLNHFLNQASQRENIAAKSYDIHENENPNIINEPIPEYVNSQKLIPDETYVLVGFYNTKKQYDWIKKGKYNFRMGSGNGSLILDKETVSSSYLLLHTHKENSSGDLWKITSRGPRVYSKEDLIKKGYPNPSQDYYLVIEIEKVIAEEFEAVTWNFKELKNYSSGRASAFPFTVTLTELMKTVKKDE